MDKLLLVDGHSILNRAFYGLPDLTNSKGEHTNAVLGFINIVFKIMEEEKPSHFAVAFDVHEKTFRHNMFEAYKGTRSGMPEELRAQVPVMKELLRLMNVMVIEAPGFEADDIIGTLSRKGEEAGMEVSVLSGDRDLLQLATEKVLIRIPKTKGGKTTVENYHAKEVEELYGVTPLEFIDMKGLMGDSSDNIPGVPGIGEKTASKIISTYHSIENAYEHVSEIKPKKAMENLSEFYDQAVMSKELATIKLDVPLDETIEDMKRSDFFTKEAYDFVKNLELKSLLHYFEVPKDIVTIDFKTRIITDLGEMESCFEELSNVNVLGLFPLVENGEFIGLGITVKEAEAVFIAASMFITEDLIVKRTMELIDKNEKMTIVTHDLKQLLKYFPIPMEQKVCDTSVGAYLLNPNKDSYGYDDIARDYLGLTIPSRKELLGKMQLNSFVLQEEKVSMYLAYETCIPFMAWKNIEKNLEKMGMMKLYEEIELPTVYVLDHMEKEGIRVDSAALKEYGEMLGQRVRELEKMIYEEAGCEFNINSPKQLGEVLFEKLQDRKSVV